MQFVKRRRINNWSSCLLNMKRRIMTSYLLYEQQRLNAAKTAIKSMQWMNEKILSSIQKNITSLCFETSPDHCFCSDSPKSIYRGIYLSTIYFFRCNGSPYQTLLYQFNDWIWRILDWVHPGLGLTLLNALEVCISQFMNLIINSIISYSWDAMKVPYQCLNLTNLVIGGLYLLYSW